MQTACLCLCFYVRAVGPPRISLRSPYSVFKFPIFGYVKSLFIGGVCPINDFGTRSSDIFDLLVPPGRFGLTSVYRGNNRRYGCRLKYRGVSVALSTPKQVVMVGGVAGRQLRNPSLKVVQLDFFRLTERVSLCEDHTVSMLKVRKKHSSDTYQFLI